MDLGAVMQDIADQLATIDGLRVYGHPPDQPPSPPAAVVTYPDSYIYDVTYGRGMDRIENLPVVALVGKVSARTSRDAIGAYANGSGASSIKAVVESGTYTEFDSVRVTSVAFDVVTIGGIDYLAATFTLDIAGAGS